MINKEFIFTTESSEKFVLIAGFSECWTDCEILCPCQLSTDIPNNEAIQPANILRMKYSEEI